MRAPTDDDEHALVRAAGRGDAAAWQALIGAHLPRVHRVAWYMLGDGAEAEDVAQDAFLRLMRKAPSWNDDGAKLGTWLHRVTMNLCIDRKRRRALLPLDHAENIADGNGGADGRDHQIAVAGAVRGALDRLNRRQRAAVVLVHYEGYSNGEAADLMGIGLRAFESLLVRARRTLKRHLQPALPDLLED